MAKFCGNCGSPLNQTSIFCGKCGTRVPAAAAPAAPYNPGPSSPAPSSADFAPVPAAFTPAPPPTQNQTQDPAGFAPVASTFTAPPVPAPDAAGFAPVGSTFTAPPVSTQDPGDFAPVPPAFPAPPSSEPDAAGFSPVPAAFTPTPVPTAEPAGFAPIAATFTAPPAPTSDAAGFAPVPAYSTPPAPAATDFTPPPPAINPTPAPAINPSGYAPVAASPGSTAASPAQAGYAPVDSSYTPAQASAPVTQAYAQGAAGYAPVPGAPASATYAQPAAGYPPAAAAYPAKKSNTLLKVVIAVIVLIFVGSALALGGLWYAAQQIKAKATQALGKSSSPAANVLGGLMSGSTTSSDNPGGFQGDPCRFLSKEEVSQAVGVTVIRTQGNDGGCSYIAKGDPADMTAKHMSSMLAGRGADAKTQQMAQKFAGAFFAQQEAGDKDLKAQAATGEIPVLGLIFTAGNAAMEMKMNRGGFQHIMAGAPAGSGGVAKSGSGDLAGIGDEAFVVGDSAIMLRKGNVMARLMYTGCPCNTTNVIPLARTLAARL